MNSSDLVDAVAAANGLAGVEAKKLVDSLIAAIGDAAAKGEEVAMHGFGKFVVKSRPARQGRNPSTGATIRIAASKKISFTPAKALKDKLNG